MKSKIMLFMIFGAILISSVPTTQVFAQGYGNVATSHSATQSSSCNAAPSPKVNWSNCNIEFVDVHFSNMAGANLSGMIATNALFYNVNLSGANLQNVT
ncbi:MAG: pentapeptide repeat-containing protein, partial [Nitrosotalea sp.]